MTNVQQTAILRKKKANSVDLRYLTAIFPSRYGVSHKIATSLNNKGLLPATARTYTETIVMNVLRGRYNDNNVKQELYSLLVGHTGMTLDEVKALTPEKVAELIEQE